MKRTILSLCFLIVGSLLLQNFQCTSPELNNAEMLYNKKDYKGAEEQLDKEFKNNPNSLGGFLLLSKIRLGKGDVLSAAKALKKVEGKLNSKKEKDDYAFITANLWRSCISNGQFYANRYVSEGNPEKKSFIL